MRELLGKQGITLRDVGKIADVLHILQLADGRLAGPAPVVDTQTPAACKLVLVACSREDIRVPLLYFCRLRQIIALQQCVLYRNPQLIIIFFLELVEVRDSC